MSRFDPAFRELAMRQALKRFLGLPRITVRRMMIYVALSALALQAMIALPPYIRMVRAHWAVCNRRSAGYSREAADCRRLGTLFPGETPVPWFTCSLAKGENPRTGAMMIQESLHYEALAKNYERARWRPWAGLPTEPPPPRPGP
jgi:hypothetical protein